jgi:hypothetical protein
MLGFLRRVRHRGDDIDDVRSHVLGERFSPELEPMAQPESFMRPEPFVPAPPAGRQRFDLGQPADYQPSYQQYGNEAEQPAFESRYGEGSNFGFPPGGQQLGRTAEKVSRDYDVADRLQLIESQLSAIRSMTETINERLKNLEAKLGLQRRY